MLQINKLLPCLMRDVTFHLLRNFCCYLLWQFIFTGSITVAIFERITVQPHYPLPLEPVEFFWDIICCHSIFTPCLIVPNIFLLNLGAMKRGRGTCSTFQSFQLTYHARTTFIDLRGPANEISHHPLKGYSESHLEVFWLTMTSFQ